MAAEDGRGGAGGAGDAGDGGAGQLPPAPLDRIEIRDLLWRVTVGVSEAERREKQDVLLDVTLHADLRAACRSDDIADTVDYKALKQRILAFLEDSCFRLIEAMAEAVVGLCLEDPRVRRAEVRVRKPGALRFARTVAVCITRDAPEDGRASAR